MRDTGIIILATLAVVAGLYLGGDFLVPIAIATILNTLLRPIVRKFESVRIPPVVGAAIIVLSLLAVVVGAGFSLAPPVRAWVAGAPREFEAAKARLARFQQPLRKLSRVIDTMEHPAQTPVPGLQTQPAAPVGQPAGDGPVKVVVQVIGTTSRILRGGLETVLLLYLMLASGGLFFQKLMRVLHNPQNRHAADAAVQEAEAVIFRFVGVTAMITGGQAILIAGVMWWLGMPMPLLWGVFTFVLEFVPYFGATVMIILLAITSLATFNTIGHILLPPASYLLISALQVNLVSPFAYGHGLKLNPVAVLIGVLFWWYVWGIPGAFLAVPILATLKTIADHTNSLRPVGEFLGE